MSIATVTLCQTCRDADLTLPAQLAKALDAASLRVELQQVDCMSGCDRPQTLSIRQSGKTAYLFGKISTTDIPDILVFLRHYDTQKDGNFADARVLGDLRFKAIARIPANLVQTAE